MAEQNLHKLERILKALANERRLSMVQFVRDSRAGEVSVGDIAEHIKLSFKSTSRHLALLEKADIFERRQESLYVYYRLHSSLPKVAKQIIDSL